MASSRNVGSSSQPGRSFFRTPGRSSSARSRASRRGRPCRLGSRAKASRASTSIFLPPALRSRATMSSNASRSQLATTVSGVSIAARIAGSASGPRSTSRSQAARALAEPTPSALTARMSAEEVPLGGVGHPGSETQQGQGEEAEARGHRSVLGVGVRRQSMRLRR